MTVEKEEEMKNKLKENSNKQDIQMKLATQRIQELDSKIKTYDKELKDFHRKEAENREQLTLLKEENGKIKANLADKEAQLKKEKDLRRELTLERDTLKEDKQRLSKAQLERAATEKSELQEKVEKLERANTLLKSEKSTE